MNNTAAHNKLLDDLLVEVGGLPDVRLWVRVVGYDQARRIKYGIPGESDLDGILMLGGRKLSIEVKAGMGKLNPDQRRYKAMVQRFGGLHITARSVEQVLEELKNAGVKSLQK